MYSGTKLIFTRAYNRKVILEVIRLNGPISRAEICRLTGLTMPTISQISSELVEENIVLVRGKRQGQRGQPAVDLEFNPEGGYAVGVYVARDHMAGVVINLAGEIKYQKTTEADHPTPSDALPWVDKFVKGALKSTQLQKEVFWGLGFAFTGPYSSAERQFSFPSDFPGWEGLPIQEKLFETTKIPVIVEHDITAAAIGEQFHHVGGRMKNFFYINVGYGLGGGMILNGAPFRGTYGNAAHIGLVTSGGQGKNKACGDVVTLKYLYQLLNDAGIEITHPDQLASLYTKKDPTLKKWLDLSVQHLTTALIALDAFFDPEAIYFGSRLPDKIMNELLRRLSRAMEKPRVGNTHLHRSQILKSNAGPIAAAIGAATLPIYEHMSPRMEILNTSQQ